MECNPGKSQCSVYFVRLQATEVKVSSIGVAADSWEGEEHVAVLCARPHRSSRSSTTQRLSRKRL